MLPFFSVLNREMLVHLLTLHGFLQAGRSPSDVELHNAVVHYQHWHGIEERGAVGRETHRSLIEPRPCLHPDIQHQLADTLLRWPYPDIAWWIDPAASFGRLSPSEVRDAFAWAWQQWSSACGIKPYRVESRDQADVWAHTGTIDGPFGVLALTVMPDGRPGGSRRGVGKEQTFDQAESWCYSEDPPRLQVDLARVACHEIGHAIGIPHLAAGNLMAPTYSASVRAPQSGDAAEAVARYGLPAAAPPPSPAMPPVPSSTRIVMEVSGTIASLEVPGFRVTRLS